MRNFLQDLWDSCYSDEHRKTMPPEEFQKTFCNQCMNTKCQNSKGSGTSWAKRILTQEERLLRNPVFSDPRDPQFKRISEMDFQNVLREVISVDLAESRGDWSIPSDKEISREAAVIFGLAPPTPAGWVPEEPRPPEKLVDEVRHTDLTGKPAPENPENPKKTKEVIGSWRVVGDSGSLWEVSQYSEDFWECSCPSFQHKKIECKHIRDIQTKIQRSSPQDPPRAASIADTPKQDSQREPISPPPGVIPVFKPSGSGNTKIPEGGLMIGGSSPPKPNDPWALPPTAPPITERVIPVGGKIQFKRK